MDERTKKVLDLFGEGRKQYKLMYFEKAKGYFQQALEVDPEDGPSKVYVQRCQHYIETPPPEDWDGVFIMTTK
jgi:tetratricopeptide (TPR) repeat protein